MQPSAPSLLSNDPSVASTETARMLRTLPSHEFVREFLQFSTPAEARADLAVAP